MGIEKPIDSVKRSMVSAFFIKVNGLEPISIDAVVVSY